MKTIDLTQNFNAVYSELEKRGDKPTNIAKTIGYTTTTQLNTALDGSSQLSTKAIINLIEKLDVNPSFLFLGQGEIFNDESSENELNLLRSQIVKLRESNNDGLKTVMALSKRNKELEQLYVELIQITSAAIKYYKTKCGEDIDESDTELNKSE